VKTKILKSFDFLLKAYRKDKYHYSLLITLFLISFFVRVYRTDSLLGFFYDQGRDALVIWDLWHKGKFFLIGPTTGLTGVFLGPLFYYLIAPFYLLGKGNPVFPAVFLAFLSVVAFGVLYYIGAKFYNKRVGLFAVIIASISYNIVYLSRWLSNPTPIFLFSVLLLLALVEIANKGNKKWWLAVALLIGLSLHFEAASAFFYIAVALVFLIWRIILKGKQGIPSLKIIFYSLLIFILTQSPQIIFNFRHDNIWFKGIKEAVLLKENVSISFMQSLAYRSSFFWNSFSNKIFPISKLPAVISFSTLGIFLLVKLKKLLKNSLFAVLLIFLITPLIGYTFFQGNYGQLFDYYLIGYYLPFILIVSIVLFEISKLKPLKYLVLIFFVLFLFENVKRTKDYITTGLDGPASVLLGNQTQILDWLYKDTQGKEFNIDVYVPPVIPYAYDYLFLWQGTERCGASLCKLANQRNVELLYTIYEADHPHPERLKAWLNRQSTIGKIEEEFKSGGITIQRRTRL
jgi:4-amino-4-deoxy-L-arabinose transferase-like glycosyltransferase